MQLDIDKELKEYSSKKILESKEEKISSDSDMLSIMGELSKAQRKMVVSNMVVQKNIEKFQDENGVLYKEKIVQVEKENLKLSNIVKSLEQKENKFVKKFINIIDELYRLKYYADNSGNEKLMNTINKNIKNIKKELADIEISLIPSLGEIFNENYHDCIEVKEDPLEENMKIVEEVKVGIIYKEKVFRAAEVVVVKN